MAESTPTTPTRNLALDNLRVVAMLLGLVTHGVLPFKATAIGRYPIHDCHNHPVADACYFAVHDFRMQLFFLLAGFAACALAARRGVGELIRNRLRRIALPLLLAVLVVTPIMHVLFTYHQVDETAERVGKEYGWLEGPVIRLSDGRVRSLAVLPTLHLLDWLGPNFHLWFLYYLLLCCGPLAAVYWLGGRVLPPRLVHAVDTAFRWFLGQWWKAGALATLLIPLLWWMPDWWIDTPQGWRLEGAIYLYYLGFFLFGGMLYRHRDRLAVFGRHWIGLLLFGNLIVLPAMLWLTISGVWAEVEARPQHPAWLVAWKGVALFLGGLYTWLMVEGLVGLFQRYFSGSHPWWRYLVEASYWCYLAGFPLQVALQVWLADSPLSIVEKFLLVNAVTFPVLLVSYELGVRHTWIGVLLNGKKPAPAGTTPAPVVLTARVPVGERVSRLPREEAPHPASTPATVTQQ